MHQKTLYPIHDLNNRLIVPAGTELTKKFMDKLCAKNHEQYEVSPLMEHGSIRKDMLGQFAIAPYDMIFAGDDRISSALEVMEQIRLPGPLFECLDFFRENDFHTYRHMLIISALSALILQNFPSKYIAKKEDILLQIGPTHDIGKITTPRDILLKKTPLTQSELDMLKHHAVAGYVLLSYYYKKHTILAPMIARDHHERRDGSGYPRRVKQQNLVTEITTICDIYDALVAKRPYRPISYDNRTALEELTWMAQRGEIGMECVRILISFNRRKRMRPEECIVSLERRGTPPEKNVYGKLAQKSNA